MNTPRRHGSGGYGATGETGETRGSRERILSRVRSAVAGAPQVEIPRAYGTSGRLDGRVELFAERVRDYRAIVHVVSEGEVAATVARALADRGARRVVVPGACRRSGWRTRPAWSGSATTRRSALRRWTRRTV